MNNKIWVSVLLVLFLSIATNMNGQTTINIEPSSQIFNAPDTVNLSININNVSDLFAVSMEVNFDGTVLDFLSVEKGEFLDTANTEIFYQELSDSQIVFDQARLLNTGVNGSGIILQLKFLFLKAGESTITITNTRIRDHENQNIIIDNIVDGFVALFPDIVYVNPDWFGTSSGVDPDGAQPAVSFNFDSFDLLQNALDVIADGGTIYMAGNNVLLHSDGIVKRGFSIDNYDSGIITLQNLQVTNDAQVELLTNVVIQQNLNVILGDVITGSDTLTIDVLGSINESNGNYIIGNTKVTRNLGTSLSSFGNVGVTIGVGTKNVGDVTILRISGAGGNVSSSSINRIWYIDAATIPDTRDIQFDWVSDDDNSINLSQARLYRSNNGGIKWINSSNEVDASSSRSISANTFDNIHAIWTVGESLTFEVDKDVTVSANIKVFLEGPFTSGFMTNGLNSADMIPQIQPYETLPWKYEGVENVGETFFSSNPEIVDWVFVELRTGVDSSTSVASRVAFVKSDGLVVDVTGDNSTVGFSTVAPGDYYLAVRHRNHLTVISAAAVTLTKTSVLYDFTDDQAKAQGSNSMMNLGDNKYGMISGDTDNDGIVDATDRSNAWNNRLLVEYLATDVNLDGLTDAGDRSIIWNNRLLQAIFP